MVVQRVAIFGAAAGVAQFNQGYDYIVETTEEMGLSANSTTARYVRKMNDKRNRDSERMTKKDYKKARRKLRKKKTQKTSALESREGATYESGIGLCQTAEESAAITNGTLDDLRTSITEEEFNSYTEVLDERYRVEEDGESGTVTERTAGKIVCFVRY